MFEYNFALDMLIKVFTLYLLKECIFNNWPKCSTLLMDVNSVISYNGNLFPKQKLIFIFPFYQRLAGRIGKFLSNHP